MNQELTEKLYKNYEKLFGEGLDFGFECGDGWYPIINKMCRMIQYNVDSTKSEQVVACQVKEKFGGLRFYINGGSEKAYDIISFFESLSYIICEKCGSTEGETKTEGHWMSTRCNSCREDKS